MLHCFQYRLLFVGSLVRLQALGAYLELLRLFSHSVVSAVALGLGLQGITKNFISG